MRPSLWTLIAALVLVFFPGAARASIVCTISATSFTAAYSTTSTYVTQTGFTVRCTRSSPTDPTTVNYDVRTDNGLYPQGINNRARQGNSYIRYDFYYDSACSLKWKGNFTISGTITFTGTGMVSQTKLYYTCILSGQAPPAGTYNDTATLTLSYGGPPASTATTTVGVSIYTPAVCTITSAPGTVVLNYLALGPAVSGSTTFGVTCTNALPYTLSFDVASASLVGLTYALSLSTVSTTGTGLEQTHTITGNISAGQPGTCPTGTCSGSALHTLILTY